MSAMTRLDELLATRATEGLDAASQRQLEELLAASPEVDADGFGYAAAALDLALSGAEEPLPEQVESRIRSSARAYLSAGEKAGERPGATVSAIDERTMRHDVHTPWAPWLLAAAAALVAVVGWWPRLWPAAPEVVVEQAPRPEESPDAVVRAWQATDDIAAADASGEVAWSSAGQTGVMRIRGLAANDPTVEQYQLWIFDRARDERYPVDGGVFDIPSDVSEVEVPIAAKIRVEEPYLFAVTVEKPGGVVVSSRERIALLAEV